MLQRYIPEYLGVEDETPVLSICMTCRDGREGLHSVRGGTRLADAVLARIGDRSRGQMTLRGVRCMSHCKRPCIVSLGAQGRFTYVFGDLDPERPDHIDALIDVIRSYRGADEGYLERSDRPEPLRASILGRFPPLDSASPIVTVLGSASAA